MKNKTTLVLRFKGFVKNLHKRDRIALLYHTDADGLCSAIIAAKAIERLRGKKPNLILHQEHADVSITNKTLSLLKKKKINKLITVDLCVDQHSENVKKASQFADILIIDHHKVYKNLNSRKIVFIKANYISKIEPSTYPASKLTFDLFSKVVNVKDLAWVAAVGTIGDNAARKWRSFIKKSANLKLLYELKELISAVEAIALHKMDVLFHEFYKAKKPSTLKKSKFKKYARIMQLEVYYHLARMLFMAEFYFEQDLVFYYFKSKYNIKSPLINRMSDSFFPETTVVVVQDSGRKYLKVSARRQDFKVKMNSLLEKTVKALKQASAGGHVPAAAGKFLKRDLKKFKKKLLANLS